MIINMTTFAGRQRHYIDRTLESLFQSDGRDIALNLILGSSDTSHVERYRNVANIVVWDQEAESQAREGQLRHNCTVNAIRALKYGDDDYCLCCEDDIVFDKTWFSQLMLTVAEIDRKEYVLNLGQGCDQSPDKRYAMHTRPYLCGAQGIFYPTKALRSAVAEYLQQNITKGLSDALIGTYAKKYTALYNTTPLLVRHIGGVSSFRQPSTAPKPARTTPANRNRQEHSVRGARQMSAEPTAVAERPADHTAQPAERKARVDRPADHTARPAERKARVDQPADHADRQSVTDVGSSDSSDRATSEILMALLRASLGTGTFPDPKRLAQCDWARFTLLATHHGLAPILYRALCDRAASVPAPWLRRFKVQYVGNAVHNQLAQTLVDEIGPAFGAEQIPVIVMKGAALVRTLYNDPGLRVLGDVDLLVDERDVERAGAQLERIGLNLIASDHADQRGPLCHIHRVYCRAQPRSIPVELHWRLFEPYLPYVFDLSVVRAQAQQISGMPANVLAMAPEHELAHLCVHLDRHAVTYRSLVGQKDWFEQLLLPQGLGRLGWLYDIALYLRHRSALVDWDGLVNTARRWAIEPRLYAPLELSRRALGVGPPPEVLRALTHGQPRFVERMAHRVVMASHRANEMQRKGSARGRRPRWLTGLAAHVQRFANTWISVFPPSAYLHAKYGTAGAALSLRGRHLREVVPGLWAEIRDRLRAAFAARPSPVEHH